MRLENIADNAQDINQNLISGHVLFGPAFNEIIDVPVICFFLLGSEITRRKLLLSSVICNTFTAIAMPGTTGISAWTVITAIALTGAEILTHRYDTSFGYW